MKTVVLPLPAVKLAYDNCSKIEAKLRSLDGVASAYMGEGYVKLSFDNYSAAVRNKAVLTLSKFMGSLVLKKGKAVATYSK